MPGLTGWETLQRLKHSPATASIPVVILSVLSPAGTSDGGRHAAAAAAGLGAKALQRAPPARRALPRPPHRRRPRPRPARRRRQRPRLRRHRRLRPTPTSASTTPPPASTPSSAASPARPTCSSSTSPSLTATASHSSTGCATSPTLRALPLVVYSGREVSDSEMSKLRLGPTQFLTKAKVQPQEVEELVLNIVHRLRPTAP